METDRNGVSAHVVTATIMCCSTDFLGNDLTRSDNRHLKFAYLFPQSVKNHYFCSDPIRVDPICPQPRLAAGDAHRGGHGHALPVGNPLGAAGDPQAAGLGHYDIIYYVTSSYSVISSRDHKYFVDSIYEFSILKY